MFSRKPGLEWDRDAESYLEKAPPFVVRVARGLVEREAKKLGHPKVSLALVRGMAERFMPFRRSASPGGGSGLETRFARRSPTPLYDAFPADSLTRNHNFATTGELPAEAHPSAWRLAGEAPPPAGPRALYIHVPFCRTRCRYCGFFAHGSEPESLRHYADLLLEEMAAAARWPSVAASVFDCVYFGGGTPTDWSADDLARVLSALRRRFALSADAEITLESRVHGFTEDKMRVAADHGVNRYSLGVQTFDTALRRSMGRVNARDEVLATLRRLGGDGGASVVVDLLYGLPGQTTESWETDLRILREEAGNALAGVDHYPLIVMPGTPLATALDEGTLPPVVGVAGRADLFRIGDEYMEAMGARRLGLKHFAFDARERNRYNRLQAASGACLPLGSGAGGHWNGYFFYQGGSLERYAGQVAAGEKPLGLVRRLDADALAARRIEGALKNEARLSPSEWPDAEGFASLTPLLGQYAECGLMTLEGDGAATLTRAGRFWHNAIIENLCSVYTRCHSRL